MDEAREAVALQCAFLRGLSQEQGLAFLATGRERRAAAGTFLFYQDDPATLFYILLEGTVRLSQVTLEGHQVILHHVTPGEGIGIIIVLSNMPYPVTAEAVEDCVLLSWDADTTREQMLRTPQLAINGMEMVAHRFVQSQDRFRELATQRVERRVAHALVRLVRQVGRRVDDGILIDMPLSRQDLAEMTGTTLFTISRILSQWERDGWIRTGREQVTLVMAHELVAVAEDLPEPSRADSREVQ